MPAVFPPDIISNRFRDVMEVGTMNRKIAGMLLGVLSLFGCSNDVQKPTTGRNVTVKTARGPVTVQDATRDMNARVMNARVVGSGIDAVLTVSSSEDAGVQSFVASLSDASGQLLYSIETRVDEAAGTITATEATAQDYLTITMTTQEDRIVETYDADGDVASFEHSALADETELRAINYYRNGGTGNVDRLPADVQEYIRGADAFHQYYLPHEISTIHNNPSGDLLVALLSSPELPYAVAGDLPDRNLGTHFHSVCSLFSLCYMYACRIAPTHPLCGACFTLSILCSIIEITCQWFGCA
jgi:hypothetical protein